MAVMFDSMNSTAQPDVNTSETLLSDYDEHGTTMGQLCRTCSNLTEHAPNGTGLSISSTRGQLLEEPYNSVVFSVLAILLIVGFVINTSTIAMFVRNSMISSPTNMLVLNLTVSNFLIATVPVPIMMAAIWSGSWTLGHSGCQFYVFAFLFLSAANTASMAAIAVERYYSLILPQVPDQKEGSLASVYKAIVAIWVLSLALSLPTILGWSSVHMDSNTLVCGLEWRQKSFSNIIYPTFFTISCILLPLVVKSCFYWRLYKKIYAVAKNVRSGRKSSVMQLALRVSRVSRRSSTASIVSNSSVLMNTINNNLKNIEKKSMELGREKKLATAMTFMVCLSCVTWCPYGVVSIIVVTCNNVSPELLTASIILAKTCVVCNPLMYLALNRKFRRMFLRSFACSLGTNRVSNTSPGEVPSQRRVRYHSQPGLYTISEMGSHTALPGSRLEKQVPSSSEKSIVMYRGYRASLPEAEIRASKRAGKPKEQTLFEIRNARQPKRSRRKNELIERRK